MKKTLLSILLAWALLLPLPAAAASEGPVSVTMATGAERTPTAAVEVDWDDGWFARDPAVYNHQLVQAAMVLSGAAYAGHGREVREGLEALGFHTVRSHHYQLAAQPDSSRAAYTFAVKDLPEAQLVAVVVRGTGGLTEWAGNLNLGAESDHAGFSQARDELLYHLDGYLSSVHTNGRPLRFLVTGHSRGGAVANLTAARLTDQPPAPDCAVYACTFAAPAVSLNGQREGYENIFNIIGQEDLVTQIPPAQWGYRRYGADLPLPSRAAWGGAYSGLFQKMRQQYRALTGQHYVSYQDPAVVEKMTDIIVRVTPTATPSNAAMLSALLQGDLAALSDLAHEDSAGALTLGLTAVRLTYQLAPLLSQERDGMASAHCMTSYYSWLAVWQGEAAPE